MWDTIPRVVASGDCVCLGFGEQSLFVVLRRRGQRGCYVWWLPYLDTTINKSINQLALDLNDENFDTHVIGVRDLG